LKLPINAHAHLKLRDMATNPLTGFLENTRWNVAMQWKSGVSEVNSGPDSEAVVEESVVS